jgi:hypothetical protein
VPSDYLLDCFHQPPSLSKTHIHSIAGLVSEEVTPVASHSGTDDPLIFNAVDIVCSALNPNNGLPRNHDLKKRRYRLVGEYAFRCAHVDLANGEVSDRGPPPLTFDLYLSETAGSGSLPRLVGCLCGTYRTSLEKRDATASGSKHSPAETRLEPRCKSSDAQTGDLPR